MAADINVTCKMRRMVAVQLVEGLCAGWLSAFEAVQPLEKRSSKAWINCWSCREWAWAACARGPLKTVEEMRAAAAFEQVSWGNPL